VNEDGPRNGHAPITIAAACDEHGRAFFASLDARHYRAIPHFPQRPEEALELYDSSPGPALSPDELALRYRGQVVAMPISPVR
jgi:hypothetical protein